MPGTIIKLQMTVVITINLHPLSGGRRASNRFQRVESKPGDVRISARGKRLLDDLAALVLLAAS